MLVLMNEFTDMDDWHRKIFDPDFVLNWKHAKVMTGQDVTHAMINWVC